MPGETLANLAEHRRDHGELTTLELLRLAAELADGRGAPIRCRRFGRYRWRSLPGWLGDLLNGLPDER